MERDAVITAFEWNVKGNEEFNKGDWSKALHYYTNALKLLGIKDDAEKGICYKNRAAAYFMLGNYEEVIKDCNSALNICCTKTLYLRCQALEALERFDEAYRDAKFIALFDPNDEVIQSVKRLYEIVRYTNHCENPKPSDRISEMDLAFNVSAEKEKRENAMTSLLMLARRDEAGAEEIFQKQGVPKIAQLVKVEKNEKLICNAICIVSELCKNSISRTNYVTKYVGLFWCLEIMNSASTERVNASQSCLQTILNTYSGMNDEYRPKPDMSFCLKYKSEIYMILSCLLNSVTSRTITGLARDAIIEFITRNMHYTELNWTKQLVDFGSLKKLMEVATQLEEHESSLDITFSTQTLISISLENIYKSIDSNGDKKKTFTNTIYEFIQDKLLKSDRESKVRGIVAIITLIFGPFEVAHTIIFKEDMIEKIFAMAETEDVLQQKAVCECVIAAATKYNKINEFIEKGVNILRKLDKSNNDIIRILVFLGFCQLSKFQVRHVISPFANKPDELVIVCKQLLLNSKKKKDMIKWAIKGLSYVTFDGSIKTKLIWDKEFFQTIIELAKISDQSVLYSVVTTLVNLCNAYDKQGFTFIPEMKALEKHVKNYFGKEYLTKDDELVQRRRHLLVTHGVTSALVSLAKMGNQNCKELTARVFSVICGKKECTETVVDEGGTEALLSLALDGTYKGKKIASQVLVHLALTLTPEKAFPGNLMKNVVQPITNLLNLGCSVNERCEVLTALYNLACVDDTMRLRIFNDSGFENFNNYMKNHNMLINLEYAKLINNLVLSREVAIQYVEQRSYQLTNFMTWSVGSEDQCTNKAVAAVEAVATLTAVSKEACEKLLSWNIWWTFLHFLLKNPDSNLKHKGSKIMLNIMTNTKDFVKKVMKIDIIMEQLRELSENNTMQNKEIKELACLVLEAVAKRDKIEEKRNESSDSTDNIKHVD